MTMGAARHAAHLAQAGGKDPPTDEWWRSPSPHRNGRPGTQVLGNGVDRRRQMRRSLRALLCRRFDGGDVAVCGFVGAGTGADIEHAARVT